MAESTPIIAADKVNECERKSLSRSMIRPVFQAAHSKRRGGHAHQRIRAHGFQLCTRVNGIFFIPHVLTN